MIVIQKCQFPSFSLMKRPRDLREVVVDAGKQPHDGSTEQHVVEMRDDEVRVGLLQVGRW